MNDALHTDPGTAAVIDAVNRSRRSHAWIARRIGMSESTIHRKLTCKSPMTVAEADRILRTLGTSFLAELRRASV
ncbi:helix-turn-helix domain-containing protein [Rathayibacter sp. AY1C1]|uniref:helix-turn-helix domain-containing protein n=1 Tax=Rathayibacter sp. AY1C1 TaxID=2080534 RepID=UPI0011B073FD|nr:helix-turn-helix domain-containing protein [Rathayibacter sp. AY1C1]